MALPEEEATLPVTPKSTLHLFPWPLTLFVYRLYSQSLNHLIVGLGLLRVPPVSLALHTRPYF